MINSDIQFLRAYGVVAVLLYHFSFLAGGYIGVDVFFVVSGYLITKIIADQFKVSSFNYFNFLHRRLKRLLPIYITSLVFTSFLVFVFGWQIEKISYFKSLLPAQLFYSNYWFIDSVSYWEKGVILTPLLHTWSLSVEVQFYIILPIFLVISFKYLNETGILITLGALVFFFFISCMLTYRSDPSIAFFSLHTRGWEFLIGSLVVFANKKLCFFVSKYRLNILCLAILGILPFYFSEFTEHPSTPTVTIVVATALVILGSKHSQIPSLKNRFFQTLGNLSYGAYLFHFPIAIFMEREYGLSPLLSLIGITCSFLIAYMGKKYIEDRVRYSQFSNIKFYTYTILISLALYFTVSEAFLANSKSEKTITNSAIDYYKTERGRNASINYEVNGYNSFARDRTFVNDNRPKVFFIGDSYSMDAFNIFSEAGLLDKVQVSAYFLNMGCQNVPNSVELSGHILPQNIKDCLLIKRVGDEELNQKIKEGDLIVLASKWTKFTSSHIEKLISQIDALGKKTLVIGRKEFLFPDDKLIKNGAGEGVALKLNSSFEYLDVINSFKEKDIPFYLDIHSIVCGSESKTCPTFTPNGIPISFDNKHLTQSGAKYIGQLISEDKDFVIEWRNILRLN